MLAMEDHFLESKSKNVMYKTTGVTQYCATICVILTYIGQHHKDNGIEVQYEFLFMITTNEIFIHVS